MIINYFCRAKVLIFSDIYKQREKKVHFFLIFGNSTISKNTLGSQASVVCGKATLVGVWLSPHRPIALSPHAADFYVVRPRAGLFLLKQ